MRTPPEIITVDSIRALLREWEADDTITAWLHGLNPDLDDRQPIVVIETDPIAVWKAAMTFAAYG